MTTFRYTLVADGPTDACLVYIINWVLGQDSQKRFSEFRGQYADTRWFLDPPKGLSDRITAGLRQFPCDVLFVHRDAERESVEKRWREIRDAISSGEPPAHVPVVPVRMTEAWLLIDERAIRRAADNPNGTSELSLPPLRKLEGTPDPKTILKTCLLAASELRGSVEAHAVP